MADLPPLPPGYALDGPPKADPNLIKPLLDAGVVPTNGYRTPGWGMAPGTPGTPNSGLPPLPQGYSLKQRGSLSGGNYVASGTVHDGDTLGLKGGGNGRLSGADAFELNQTGMVNGQSVPLGAEARARLAASVTPSTSLQSVGAMTYGRPVVIARNGSTDLGLDSINAGLSVPVPQYLANDPVRSQQYLDAQRGAIADERGAYAGTYQTPSDYRHCGAAIRMRTRRQTG